MILISWISQETTTLAEGGDAMAFEYESLILDGTVSEAYDAEATATEHPVEDGVNITDHVRPGLRRIELDIAVSAHPGPGSEAWQDSWTIDGEEDTRPARVRQRLEDLVLMGMEVSIETEIRAYESMLLLGLSESRSIISGDGLRARLSARELRRVSTEEAPAPRVERGRRRADLGRGDGDATDATASSDARDRASTLAHLRDAAPDIGRALSSLAGGS